MLKITINIFKKELLPTINKIYPQKDWSFIQDRATSHTSNLIQDFLKENHTVMFHQKRSVASKITRQKSSGLLLLE